MRRRSEPASKRGLGLLLGCALALTLPRCLPTSSTESNGSGTPSICPTPKASAVLTDPTGQALADAHALYSPTPLERKTLATWWLFVLAAKETGAVDPALAVPELHAAVVAITQKYVGLWEPCSGSAPATAPSSRPRLITSPDSFSCEGNCIPSAAVLQDSLSAVVDVIGNKTIEPVRDIFDGLKELSEGIQGAKNLGKDVIGVIDSLMSEQDSLTVLKSVSELVVDAGALAGAAVLLGATSPVLSSIAAAGAAVGSIMLVVDVGTELAQAWKLRQQCLDYQAEQCSACHCAVEVINYGSPGATDECVEWVGNGPSAFCFSMTGSANECCTCDSAAVTAFNDCASLLSFQPNPTAADYEKCCAEASGIQNPKNRLPPTCPCEPPVP